MISLIAAHSANKVIGKNNDLPWYIPEDLKRFKSITTGHTVIMGRNTYQSIFERLGKPLPNRRNIVVSSTLKPDTADVEVAPNLEQAIKTADNNEVFIIGGEQLYRYALEKKYVDRMYITLINSDFQGDAFFPDYDTADWRALDRQAGSSKEFSYEFITYERQDN
jgi:dihydrofolate reductase